MFNKIAAYFRSLVVKLLELHDVPHSLAGGVAIGMFIGFTPLFGLKTLLCLGLAYLLRCNPIAAVIAVTLHDLVTPFWPVFLEFEYTVGSRLIGFFNGVVYPVSVTDFHVHDLLRWTTFFTVGLPMLLGSIFLSVPAAAISYAIMLPVFKRRARLRLDAQQGHEGEGI